MTGTVDMPLNERAYRAIKLAREHHGSDIEVVGYLSMHIAVLEDLILNSMGNLPPEEQKGVEAYLLTLKVPKDET